MAADRIQRDRSQQIDFLPQHYREDDERRRTQAWRILIICIFAFVLPTASLYQYRLRLLIDRQLAQLDETHQDAQRDAQRLSSLSNQLTEKATVAQLATFLRHPWPPTQIVAAIVERLPESIAIEEMIIRRISPPVQQTTNEGDADRAKPTPMPAVEDLKTLEQQAKGEIVVELTGQTVDNRQLHHYLSELARNPLFVRADLGSMESVPARQGRNSAARFEAQLSVRPGYSLPGGPPVKQQVAQDDRPEKSVEDPS